MTTRPHFATHRCKMTNITSIYRMLSSLLLVRAIAMTNHRYQTVLGSSLLDRHMKRRGWALPFSLRGTVSARKCRPTYACSRLPRQPSVLSIEEICASCNTYCFSKMSKTSKMKAKTVLLKQIAHLTILRVSMKF